MDAKDLLSPVNPFYRALFFLDKDDLAKLGVKRTDVTSGKATGFVMARMKWNSGHSPYLVHNEMISAALGAAIHLPVPPCALSKTAAPWPLMFSALDFNPSGLRSPRVLPDLCMKHLEFLCTGVILFDIWIANEDRHDENLAVDSIKRPKLMRVFDHCQALFGGAIEIGVPRLEKLWDRLGITGSTVTGGNPHCLLPWLKTNRHIDAWVHRIESVPEWHIREICNSMRVLKSRKKEETDAAAEFLIHRQKVLRGTLVPLLCDHCKIPSLAVRQRTFFT